MAVSDDILKKFRGTAEANRSYRNKWLSDVNWVELINHQYSNDEEMTYQQLNNAISRNKSVKDVVDLLDGTMNRTGIYRQKRFEASEKGNDEAEASSRTPPKGRMAYYYLISNPGDRINLLQGTKWWDYIATQRWGVQRGECGFRTPSEAYTYSTKICLSIGRQHYNGQCPLDIISCHVDIRLYPDPTVFDWTFTESLGATEFFEKRDELSGGLFKLDWYFTTATAKTSLNHPTQGKTQLFGKVADPDTYCRILENPRAHTGNRYH